MQTIQTTSGSIEIVAPTPQLLTNLREVLPFGLCRFIPEQNGAHYGLVMQVDDEEIHCIKQQPVEVELDTARRWMDIHHWMCVEGLTRYIATGFTGAYLPAPYLRQRDNGLWEAGVSHFIFPSPHGIEALEFPPGNAFDGQFGHGTTVMFEHFVKKFIEAFATSGITPPAYFGLDVRPRLHLGALAMFFMAFGPHVICLRANLREDEDLAWGILAAAGVKQVIHLPAQPLGIARSDLPTAKGRSVPE